MNNQPRRTLRRIIKHYGVDIIQDPRRTEALLKDLCGGYRREIFVLVNAQRQQVPTDMLSAPAWMPRAALYNRLSRRLQDKLALAEEAADWAVESWAFALDLIQVGAPGWWPWPGYLPVFSRNKRTVAGKPTQSSRATKSPLKRQNRRDSVKSPRAGSSTETQKSGESADPELVAGRYGVQHRTRRVLAKVPAPRALNVVQLALWTTIVLLTATLAWIIWTDSDPPEQEVSPAVVYVPTATPIHRQPAVYLAKAYPLPRSAWVSEGPLFVRSGPSLDDDYLTALQPGQQVTVNQYSLDGEWSHISEPAVGWVNNGFLVFLDDVNGPVEVHISIDEKFVSASKLDVRSGPGANFDQIGVLEDGVTVVTVATTSDGVWNRIEQPHTGWILADELQVAQ